MSAISQSFSIIGKFLGGFLLTLINCHYIIMSFINAATFGIAAIFLALIGNVIVKKEKINKDDVNNFEGLKFLKKNPEIKLITFFLSNINIVLAPILPIVYILLAEKKIFSSVNYSMSIALLAGVNSLASILGPTIGLKLFKGKKSLINSIIVSAIFSTIFCLSVFCRNIYVLMVTIFLSSFFIGATIPLLFGRVVKDVPENKLGSVNGVIDTVLAITPPISTFIFTSSVQYISAFMNILILGSFNILLILIAIKNKKDLF